MRGGELGGGNGGEWGGMGGVGGMGGPDGIGRRVRVVLVCSVDLKRLARIEDNVVRVDC